MQTASTFNGREATTTPRENHLGNDIGGGKSASSFNWTLPYDSIGMQSCAIRIRYNVTSGDVTSNGLMVTVSATSALNGGNSPLKDRVNSEVASYQVFQEFPVEDYPAYRLGTEVNTNQFGRVFQDRSYIFSILPPPSSGACAGRSKAQEC